MLDHISSSLDDETAQWVSDRVEEVKEIYYAGIRDMVCHFDGQGFNDEELLQAWELLKNEPKIRTAYKLFKETKLQKDLGIK